MYLYQWHHSTAENVTKPLRFFAEENSGKITTKCFPAEPKYLGAPENTIPEKILSLKISFIASELRKHFFTDDVHRQNITVEFLSNILGFYYSVCVVFKQRLKTQNIENFSLYFRD